MENITHTLAGVALSRAGLQKRTPLATAALVVSANLPDIEVFGSPFGLDYLESHRGITHSLAGAVILASALASCFHVIDRMRHRDAASRSSFRVIWIICLAGVFSHVALDFLNDYGIRPWMPFSSAWHYGDLLSIVDPWVWIILGSGIYLVTRSKGGQLGWLGLGCLMFVAVSLGRSVSTGIIWIVLLVVLLSAGFILQRHGRNPALGALVMLVLYVGGVSVARESVARAARARAPGLIADSIVRIDVLPGRPASSRPWTVVAETPGRFHVAEVGLQNWQEDPPAFEAFEKNLGDPCYLASLDQPQMAVMARFARYPSVSVETSGDACTVWLRDIRYARKNQPGWGVARATVHLRPARPVASR